MANETKITLPWQREAFAPPDTWPSSRIQPSGRGGRIHYQAPLHPTPCCRLWPLRRQHPLCCAPFYPIRQRDGSRRTGTGWKIDSVSHRFLRAKIRRTSCCPLPAWRRDPESGKGFLAPLPSGRAAKAPSARGRSFRGRGPSISSGSDSPQPVPPAGEGGRPGTRGYRRCGATIVWWVRRVMGWTWLWPSPTFATASSTCRGASWPSCTCCR